MKRIFQSGNSLPPVIHDLVNERGFDSLEPGEETWVTPWSVDVNSNSEIQLRKSVVEREHKPGGTVSLKLVADFDGIYLDATALLVEDIVRNFKPVEENFSEGIVGGSEDDFVPVLGVLYPRLEDLSGMEPGTADAFNREQQEARTQFADYFRDTYHRRYIFAEEEYPGYRHLPGLE